MTYLYLSKLGNNYYIMNSSEIYHFNEPSSNHGLSCRLDSSYDELTLKAGGIYGRVADQAIELDTLLKGCKAFKQEEANLIIIKLLNEYLASINPLDFATLDIQVKEAETYITRVTDKE